MLFVLLQWPWEGAAVAVGEQSVHVGEHQQKCSFYLCAPVKVHLCEFLCVLVSGELEINEREKKEGGKG